jgi:Uma2 family endonuclease
MAGTLLTPVLKLPDPPDPPARPCLPTEDDLPYSDGVPLETEWHVLQMTLLRQPLKLHWPDRRFFVGGDMFLYFSEQRVFNADFRGPDLFVVLDVPVRARKSWVVWQEGKAPDLIIELMSPSTRELDRTVKKQVYQDELRVPEYFWFDPQTREVAGWLLHAGVYQQILPDAEGRYYCPHLELCLMRWEGVFERLEASWIRWATPDGVLLPTPAETADAAGQKLTEAQRAAAEAQRAAVEAQRAAVEAQRAVDEAKERATAERLRAERMAEKLRALGVDPEE